MASNFPKYFLKNEKDLAAHMRNEHSYQWVPEAEQSK